MLNVNKNDRGLVTSITGEPTIFENSTALALMAVKGNSDLAAELGMTEAQLREELGLVEGDSESPNDNPQERDPNAFDVV